MDMEIKKFIDLFKKQARLFWFTVGICIFVGVIWQTSQRDFFVGNLTLNITRGGREITSDYQYHDFYRLQADERFADTVVRWLQSPRIVTDIYGNIGLSSEHVGTRTLSRLIKAERLSSQVIQVTYQANDEQTSKEIAHSIVNRLNQESEALNVDSKEYAWFVIRGDEPITRSGKLNTDFVVTVSFLVGLFFGFWAVLFKHYMSRSQQEVEQGKLL